MNRRVKQGEEQVDFEAMDDLELFMELTRWSLDERKKAALNWAYEHRPEMFARARATMWAFADVRSLGQRAS